MEILKAAVLSAVLAVLVVTSGCAEPELATTAVTYAPTPTPIPRTIGIQAGHGNGDTGASFCSGADTTSDVRDEATLNFAIATEVVDLLETVDGYEADLFVGEDPGIRGYEADAFVAIHADQGKPGVTGYKVSRYGGEKASGLDGSGDQSDKLVQAIWDEYGDATGLAKDGSPGHFTNNMLYYYALRWADSSTPGAIIETGWLCDDLDVLIDERSQVALGIARGIVKFLGDENRKPSPLVAAPAESASERNGSVIAATVTSSTSSDSACIIKPDATSFCSIGEIFRLGEVWGSAQTGFDDVAMAVTGWDSVTAQLTETDKRIIRVEFLLVNEGEDLEMMVSPQDTFRLQDDAGTQFKHRAPMGAYVGDGTTSGILGPGEKARANEHFVVPPDSTGLKFVYASMSGGKVVVDLGAAPATIEPPVQSLHWQPQMVHRVGDVIEIPEIAMVLTVRRVEFPSATEYVKVRSGERLVAVNAMLENTGSEAFGEFNFVPPVELKDSAGWRYAPVWSSAVSGQYFPGRILPGEQATGQVVFRVPENVENLMFVLQARHSQRSARVFVAVP